jgi:hypothetical protein
MSETLAQTITRLTTLIKEKAPTVDISPGSVFNELIVGLESQIQNQVYNDIADISAAKSINAALSSLDNTYDPIIDSIASNYGVLRNQGRKSTGKLKVYVSVAKNYVIPANTIFIQPTLNYSYVTESVTTIDYLSDPSVLISENGLFYFTLDVVADTVGQRNTIGNGTQFNLVNTTQLPGFVKAEAQGSFLSGLDTETDKELIARFKAGLGVKNLLSVNSITSKLTDLYPSFQAVHLADSSSEINTRSLSNLLGIKIPGCVDAYVKNGITIPHTTFTITDASYIGSGKWRLTIPSTAAPGFYRVVSIEDHNSTSVNYLKYQVTYGYESDSPNLLNNATDARYSIYQTATIDVDYTAPVSNEVIPFDVTVLAAPDLDSIQALFLDSDNRIPCSDYLVKGIVPCLVSLSLSLIKNNPGDVIDEVALQGDIFDYINSLKVGESIAVSKIVNICHKYNIARVDLPIVLNGRILAPYKSVTDVTDSDIIIAGTDFLAIPNLPARGVTKQNTMFYISYFNDNGLQNINISLK